jgi:hypothetical protein
LVGAAGIGKWQVPEYDEALDKWVNSGRKFPLIVVLLEGQTAPGLQFLRQLHWIVTLDPASENTVRRIFDGATGGGTNPGELWRYTSPYRGLEAMEEKDSDYFFGRKRETVDALSAFAGAPDRLLVLIGNSGVGKSSLAQAGVLAALKRQAWPEDAGAPMRGGDLRDSRQWCFLSLKPGTDPLKALGSRFLIRGSSRNRSRPVTRQHGWLRPCRAARLRCPIWSTPPSVAARNSINPSRRAFFFTSTRVRNFTCAPRSASASAFPNCWRRRCLTRVCAR